MQKPFYAILPAALFLGILLAPLPLFAQETPGADVPGQSLLYEEAQQAEAVLTEKAELERGDPGFWNYALSTLIIRFVGIFIVLGILQVMMQVSGRIFRGMEERKKRREATG
ncbi:MAG: hypothetical protein JRI97_03285 [Deltaproteobacteria bacterium]|nr:hypothetical protein [Deltaproteobacteria bacterium]